MKDTTPGLTHPQKGVHVISANSNEAAIPAQSAEQQSTTAILHGRRMTTPTSPRRRSAAYSTSSSTESGDRSSKPTCTRSGARHTRRTRARQSGYKSTPMSNLEIVARNTSRDRNATAATPSASPSKTQPLEILRARAKKDTQKSSFRAVHPDVKNRTACSSSWSNSQSLRHGPHLHPSTTRLHPSS